jgi:hypothetical protein
MHSLAASLLLLLPPPRCLPLPCHYLSLVLSAAATGRFFTNKQ